MLEIQLLRERLKLRTLKEEKSNLYPQEYSEAKQSEICNDCLNWIIRHFKTFPFHRSDQTRIVRRIISVHAGWKLYYTTCLDTRQPGTVFKKLDTR